MIEQGDLTSDPVEWENPAYWSAESLDQEIRRQLDVCNSCRLCFNLCPAFPRIFIHFDSEEVDADPGRLTPLQLAEFVDLCYHCKLCFVKCPYTPPHHFRIDIPKLVLRARAVEAKAAGVSRRDRWLSSPDETGPLASRLAPAVNWANRNPVLRRLLETFLGIHRQKILPRFHRETFERWFQRTRGESEPRLERGTRPRVAFFHTCLVNFNEPQIGRAMTLVLERNHADLVDPPGQVCCGMPYLESGRFEEALTHFRANLAALRDYIEAGYEVIVPEPTCGMMLKKEYAAYLRGEERELALEISRRTSDLSEYLLKLKTEGRLELDFPQAIGRLTYHQPCHLKYQAIGNRTVELLRTTGAEVVVIDKGCSGHDGTWAMKTEYFDLAQGVARRLHRAVAEAEAELNVTDCTLAGLQITQGTGKEVHHPIEILARAYGLDPI
jgi:Fe-S oxidoreductase